MPVDLDLLSEDAKGASWRSEGLRLVGRAQMSIASYRSAKRTWNTLRRLEPADMEAAIRITEIEGWLGAGTTPAPLSESSLGVVVFTGHRIDTPGRSPARFPADAEVRARSEIRRAVAAELVAAGGRLLGLAGGANGGDILFHEVCAELGIATELFLAIPEEEYIPHSVRSEDPSWVARFRRLTARIPARVLAPSAALPPWLHDQPGGSIWQRANLWLVFHALHCTDAPVTLLALWDGAPGDGTGGTSDFLAVARELDIRTVVLDTRRIVFGDDNAETG